MHRILENMIDSFNGTFGFIGLSVNKIYKMVVRYIKENLTLKLTNSTGDNLIDYKIYGNSTQEANPTPSTPKAVISLGEPKNLLVYPYQETTKTVNGITFTDNGDGSITLSGTNTGGIIWYLLNTANVKEGNTYFGSGCPYTDGTNKIGLKFATSNVVDTGRGVSFVASDDIEKVYIRVGEGATANNLVFKPQLEEGSTATSYEPYRANNQVNVITSGKNLFDSENWYNTLHSINQNSMTKETVDGVEYYKFCPEGIYSYQYMLGEFKENTQYTITAKARKYDNVTQISTGFKFVYTDGTNKSVYVENTLNEYVYSITSTAGKTISYIMLVYNLNNYVLMRDIQLEEGSTATSYEPYVAPTTTTIDLTGHEPLRKIGDVSDYIDYANQKIVRNIGKWVFDGTESIFSFANGLYFEKLHTSHVGLCTHFLDNGGASYINGTFSTAVNNYAFHFIVTDTSEQFKTWLSGQYNAGTPVIVYYQLATPIEEPISLPTIPTIEGTTILEIDNTPTASNMYAKYYSSEE